MSEIARKLKTRIAWWHGALAYDREHQQSYVLAFTVSKDSRCRHRTRLLGIRCFRFTTYDGWCGLHNSLCRAHIESNRCDGKMED